LADDLEDSDMTALWPVERVSRLRTLAERGLSATAIGIWLGCGKNAVVGACHRNDVQLLVSNRGGGRTGPREPLAGRPAVVRRVPVTDGATLPPLASESLANGGSRGGSDRDPGVDPLVGPAGGPAPPHLASLVARKTPDAPKPPVVEKAPVAPRVPSIFKQCQWLFGDRPFRQCVDAAKPGSAYCHAHHARAYVHRSAPLQPECAA
jgi:hypothetical protein